MWVGHEMSGYCPPVLRRTAREPALVFLEIHPPWPRVAHKELCSRGRTVSPCGIRVQDFHACTLQAEYRDNRAVESSSGRDRLHRYRGSGSPRDNASRWVALAPDFHKSAYRALSHRRACGDSTKPEKSLVGDD